MSDHREEAEELAGPHYPGCRLSAVTLACTCHIGERAVAIEAALERAAKDRDAEWVEALWPGNLHTTFGEAILTGGPAMAAKVSDEARDIQAGEVRAAEAESWRKGRDAAADLAHDWDTMRGGEFMAKYGEEIGLYETLEQAIRAFVPPTEEKPKCS